MHARTASLLLITSATILSYIFVLSGGVVLPIYRTVLQPKSLAELLAFIPPVTLFACDHLLFIVGLLFAACVIALAGVWRLPARIDRCVTAGLCAQWLIVWAVAFCFCYDGFLGRISMYHLQHFDFARFMSVAGGVFPVSLTLILLTLIFTIWPGHSVRNIPGTAARPNPLVEEICHRLERGLFHPFAIVLSNETKYRIPGRDHISLAPRGTRLVIWSDRGVSNFVAASGLTRLEEEPPTTEQAA